MRLLTIIVIGLLLMGGHDGECRGPHHPRGESVVKRHVHYRPTKGREQEHQGNIMQDAELLHDRQHIQEHLEEMVAQPNLDNLTDDELDFYYFQVHDVDKNNMLDGLEILQAIQHTQHHHEDDDEDTAVGEEAEEEKDGGENNLEFYTDLIDKVFSEDDTDNDGYLSYAEYKAGREKDTTAAIASATRRPPTPSVDASL